MKIILNRYEADLLVQVLQRHPLDKAEVAAVESILLKAEVPEGKPGKYDKWIAHQRSTS